MPGIELRHRSDAKIASKSWFLLVGLLFSVCLLVVRANPVLGRIHKNAGFIALNYALNATPPNANNLFDTAKDWLISAENRLPFDPSITFTSGFLEFMRDRTDAAFTIWERNPYSSTEQAFRWGDKYRTERDFDKSLSWYQAAAAISPQTADTWYRIGLIYEDQQEYALATTAYQTALEKDSLLQVKIGDILFRVTAAEIKGVKSSDVEWDSVLIMLDSLLSEDAFSVPFHRIQTHYMRAEALRHLGNNIDAITEYEWVIAHRPNDFWSHTHLGWLVWQEYKNLDDAAMWLLKAIEIDPRSKWGYRTLGDVYKEVGKDKAALVMYRNALMIDPNDLQTQAALQQLAE